MNRTSVTEAPPAAVELPVVIQPPPTPMTLIEKFAADPNFNVANLQALIAMQKDWEADQAKKAFFLALAECQKAIPAVIRDGTNSQTESKFATLDAVNRIVRPVLANHGFAVSFAEEDCPIKTDKIWKRTIADLRHKGGHCERYHIDLPLDGFGAKGQAIGAMNPVQAAVSTGTYGQRVLLCRILNLAIADSDADGNEPGATLNDEQVEMIEKLITETGTDLDRFLKFAKAESVKQIFQKDFPKVRDTLNRKKKTSPEVQAALKEWQEKLDNVNNVDQLNGEIMAAFKKMPESDARKAVWEFIKETADNCGIAFNSGTGKFYPKGAN